MPLQTVETQSETLSFTDETKDKMLSHVVISSPGEAANRQRHFHSPQPDSSDNALRKSGDKIK